MQRLSIFFFFFRFLLCQLSFLRASDPISNMSPGSVKNNGTLVALNTCSGFTFLSSLAEDHESRLSLNLALTLKLLMGSIPADPWGMMQLPRPWDNTCSAAPKASKVVSQIQNKADASKMLSYGLTPNAQLLLCSPSPAATF